MKFGKVDNPEEIDFTLPPDHVDTSRVLAEKGNKGDKPEIYVGCAKWNRQDLKGFYPRGTKDELTYYATQFNSIELNATFYNMYGSDQFRKWGEKAGEGFKFFPKIPQMVSHMKRLLNVRELTHDFVNNASVLEDKLGMIFLQLHDNFKPKDMDRLRLFLEEFPNEVPLAVELRNTEWFNNEQVTHQIYSILEENDKTNIIVDTAGRRDLLHMRLTTPYAFVRYVGANIASDYTRLNDWLDRMESWIDQGIKGIYFFIHQNLEKESPLLAASFIEKLNKRFGYNIHIPQQPEDKKGKTGKTLFD